MATTSDRRILVNLTVVASSAAMFAAAWAGIAEADGDRYAQEDVSAITAMALPSTQPAGPLMNAAPVVSDAPGAPTPAPRRVVVVRQSRAS